MYILLILLFLRNLCYIYSTLVGCTGCVVFYQCPLIVILLIEYFDAGNYSNLKISSFLFVIHEFEIELKEGMYNVGAYL